MALSFTTLASVLLAALWTLQQKTLTQWLNDKYTEENNTTVANTTVARLLINKVDELGLDVLRQMLKRWSNLQVQTRSRL